MNPLLTRLKQVSIPTKEVLPPLCGRLSRVVGLTLECTGIKVPIGTRCRIETGSGPMFAEAVGFSGKTTYLMPAEEISGVENGDLVVPLGERDEIPYSDALLGRVLDGTGHPIDGLGPLIRKGSSRRVLRRVNPMNRRPIREPMDVGVRCINALFTVGQGQRMGLFAGSGVGKSVLLGMMTRGSCADVAVVGLVGERGREVKEFIDDILGEEGRRRSVVVAAPADASPLMRLKGCETSLSIAEYFRDQGKNVLLLIDSLTRYAMAQREIALAVGEPPATKGYPPSVFAKLPALVERAGQGNGKQGSITAFFTVLTEGDDLQDPIADSARAILDGHIVLSRALADAGHYPAIDVEKSISRVMPAVVTQEHLVMARTIRQCTATYNESRELIQIGAYRQGSDPRVDQAVMIHPYIDEFTQQDFRAVIPYAQSVEDMKKIAMILIGDAQKRTEQLQRQQHQAAKNNPVPNNAFTRSDRQG
ncbi:MAG: flagellar protein export ATPase FliI [Succinatimonas sp.]|nr:flagellar protein export ATPase FliI [Succinatimonas sp.]